MAEIDRIADELDQSLRGRVLREADLAVMTSMRVGGRAEILASVQDPDDLAALARVVAGRCEMTVLGRGSNVLISDQGFPGVIIRLGKAFDHISGDEPVEAGASASLPRLANHAARRNRTGMEFAVAIPAAVGGAVKMNAGAHGASISDVLLSATIIDLQAARVWTASPDDLKMGYRETNLRQQDVVMAARFSLKRGDPQEIRSKMDEYRQHRFETQPSDAPNAGSMFRNPEGGSAGQLIEAAGAKGLRVGGAEVSTKHANFFLAHPGARAQDVFDLMVEVQTRVEMESGVLLVPEIRLIGAFDSAERLRWA